MKNPFKKDNRKEGAQNIINIEVYMRFGADVRHLRAEYTAEEKKDEYNNLVAINKRTGHNEDQQFTQEMVYESMGITLGIEHMEKEEAVKYLEKEIKKYEKRVAALEAYPELNVLSNYWDEKRALRVHKIYKNYLFKRSEKGSYYEMKYGVRTYKYESVDGFLIPIWQEADNLSDYPDYTIKKKITMQETANFDSYLNSKGGMRMAAYALIIILVVAVIFAGLNIWGGLKIWGIYDEKADQWAAPADYCAEQMATSYGVFTQLMENALIQEELKNETDLKKDVKDRIRQLNPN